MAVAGDVMIRLALDVAEFTKGMSEATRKLDELGAKSEQQAKKVEGFAESAKSAFGALKGLAAASGVAVAFSKIAEEVDKVKASVLKLGEAADAVGLTVSQYQGLSEAASAAGMKTDALAAAYARFDGAVKSALGGNKAQIDAFDKLGIKLLDAQGNIRSTTSLFEDFARKVGATRDDLARQNLEQAFLGTSGGKVDAALRNIAGGFDTMAARVKGAGREIDDVAVAKLGDLEKRAAEAKEKWDSFWTIPIATVETRWAERKTAILEESKSIVQLTKDYGVLAGVRAMIAQEPSMRDAKPGEGPKLPDAFQWKDLLGILANDVPKAMDEADVKAKVLTQSIADLSEKTDDSRRKWLEANEALANAIRVYGAGSAQVNVLKRDVEGLTAAIEKQTQELDKLTTGRINAAIAGGQNDMPKPPPVTPRDFGRDQWGNGRQPPATVTGGAGAGGGRTVSDTLDNQIEKYKAMGDAAKRAYDEVIKGSDKSIEQVQREVGARVEAENAIAKLLGKDRLSKQDMENPAIQKQVEQLKAQVIVYKEADALLKQREQDMIRAREVEEQYGDGTQALTRRTVELNREFATGRMSAEAYARAMKALKEQVAEAANEAKRGDNDFGSLAAGFENAAKRYAKAHDMFSTGEQVFQATTDAMGEALDVLAGKSKKSFGEIAASFADMLAKMALQAAMSQVFKAIFGGGGGLGSGSGILNIGGIGANASPAAAVGPVGASSGGMFSGIGSWLGGLFGAAGGGDVPAGQPVRVGEKGPEILIPQVDSTVMPAGSFAPADPWGSAGGNAGAVTIHNYGGGDVRAERQPDGSLAIVVERVRQAIARDVSRGGNLVSNALERSYGVSRAARA